MIPASAASSEQRSAQVAVRALGTTAVAVAGVASIGANLLALVEFQPGVGAWTAVAATSLIWAFGFTLRDRNRGFAVSIGALLLLYSLPLVMPMAWSWLSFGVLSSCIAVSAAIALPPRWSAPIIAISVALMSWYAASPVGVTVDMHLPVIMGWAAPLFNLCVAVGIALWRAEWVRAARQSDEALAHATERHAQAQHAIAVSEARVSVARSLHETVLNTLVAIAAGTSPSSIPHLRQVCRDDLERVRAESRADAVIVRTPAQPLPPALERGIPSAVLVTGDRRLRLAASSGMVFGVLTVGFVLASLPIPLALLIPYGAFVGVIIALVWWWHLQRTLAGLSFLLLATAALLIGTVQNTPGFTREAAGALDWLINVGAASMILPTLTVAAGPIVRIVFPWTLLLANIAAIMLLPADERLGPTTSLFVTTLFLGGMAGAAIWLFRRIDRQDARARDLLSRSSDAEYARVHRAELLTAWSAVSRATQDLLGGIGSGRLDPADADVQRRAQTEATILRSRLRMARTPSSAVQASLERVLLAASEAGTPVDVTIIVPSTSAHGLPAAVERHVIDLVDRCTGSPVAIRLVGGDAEDPDELVITAAEGPGLAFVATFPNGPTVGDWRAVVEDHDSEPGTDRARISLSCHDFAMADS